METLSAALYLLSQKFFHRFSKFCGADLAVAVGVELGLRDEEKDIPTGTTTFRLNFYLNFRLNPLSRLAAPNTQSSI